MTPIRLVTNLSGAVGNGYSSGLRAWTLGASDRPDDSTIRSVATRRASLTSSAFCCRTHSRQRFYAVAHFYARAISGATECTN